MRKKEKERRGSKKQKKCRDKGRLKGGEDLKRQKEKNGLRESNSIQRLII